ncbi:MAG: PHP domain-containing protein [Nanoarchaeota archaeon]
MSHISFSKIPKKSGYRYVDMHFHTTHSDGAATVDQILEKIRRLNIGVAITDHTEIAGSVEAFSKKKKSDFLIPGVELRSNEEVDVLFYFYNIDEMKQFFEKEIIPRRVKVLICYKTNLSLEEIYELSKKYNCVACIPHPFGYSMRGGSNKTFEENEPILKKFDVIEAINGGTSRKNNEKAVEYIKKNNMCYSGGTDGHSIYPLGNVLTFSKAKTIKEFLGNIKNKKNHVMGKEMQFNKLGEYFYYSKNKIRNVFKK